MTFGGCAAQNYSSNLNMMRRDVSILWLTFSLACSVQPSRDNRASWMGRGFIALWLKNTSLSKERVVNRNLSPAWKHFLCLVVTPHTLGIAQLYFACAQTPDSKNQIKAHKRHPCVLLPWLAKGGKKGHTLWQTMLNQHPPPSLFIYHHPDKKKKNAEKRRCSQKWQERSFFPADMFPDCCRGSFWNGEPAASVAAGTGSSAN